MLAGEKPKSSGVKAQLTALWSFTAVGIAVIQHRHQYQYESNDYAH